MRPSGRLLALIWALVIVAGLSAWFNLPPIVFYLLFVVFLSVTAADLLLLFYRPQPVVQRHLPKIVPVNQPFVGRINLQYRGKGKIKAQLLEQCPEGMSCEFQPRSVVLDQKPLNVTLDYKAVQRGSRHWQWLQWTDDSLLGLWRRRSLIPCPSVLAVYPDYARSRRQLSISMARSMHELGIVQQKRAGDSQEFHQLRAYQQGDSMRQIDWKATSRRRQLVTREYTEESNQSLVLMLDCGRRMRLRNGPRELLDDAMDASLMVAEIALRQGDKVSVQCFAAEPFYWSGVNKTPQAISAMLAQLHDVHSQPEASDYVAAAQRLRSILKQRSTVVLVTHTRNESLEELSMAAKILSDRHRVVLADMHDGILQQVLAEEPQNFDQTMTYLGALEYQDKRLRAQRQLKQQGTDVADVAPHQLVSALVQAYHRHRGKAA